MRTTIFAILICSAATATHAAAISTYQQGTSDVRANGAVQASSSDNQIDGSVSVFAIWPDPRVAAGPQARTAARSSASEMAVNARTFSEDFNSQLFDEVISAARFDIHAEPSGLIQRAAFDFHLPPSYVEIVSNAEFPQNRMEATVFATISVCFELSCSSSDDQRFVFQAILESSYLSYQPGILARGDPGLDLTPLLNPIVIDENTGFLRTVRLEFPAFTGHLDLGPVSPNDPLTVEYQMQARARGRAQFSSAIGAINDPFLLSTDPLPQSPVPTLTLAPVPLPAAWLLFGTVGVLFRRKRNLVQGSPHKFSRVQRVFDSVP